MTGHDAAIHRFGQWWKRARRAGHAYAEGAARHGRAHGHWVSETRRMLLWGLWIARNSRDGFGAMLAVGLVGALFWPAVINVAMVLGLAPVIGVPLDASPLGGMDSLLATVQMPAGIPVATLAIGKAGAINAAVLCARIFSLQDPAMVQRLEAFMQAGARLG